MEKYAQSLLLASAAAAPPPPVPEETARIALTISALGLQRHIEGGYFAETDRDSFLIPNPFLHTPTSRLATSQTQSATRNASTSIYYMLTPCSPVGAFHRNKGRTIHTLHRGRARYVVVHADGVDGEVVLKARVESFTVGPDTARGEKLQWVVEGGKFKASFLLPDAGREGEGEGGEGVESGEGCLISETVVPGFEYADHDFMTAGELERLVDGAEVRELGWLLRTGEKPVLK